jgi:hypothetical protein
MTRSIELSDEALREIRECAAGDRLGWKIDATGREIIAAVTEVVPLCVGDRVAVPPLYKPPQIGEPEDARGDALVAKTYGAGWWRGRIAFAWESGLFGVARAWDGDAEAVSHVDVPADELHFCT